MSENDVTEVNTKLFESLRNSLHAATGLAEMLAETASDADRGLAEALVEENRRIEQIADELVRSLTSTPTIDVRDGNRAVVWVVDDSPVNRLLTTSQLDRLGHESLGCASGLEALNRRRAGEQPDLVLLDWHMPEIDGLETAKRFRSLESELAAGPVPIIALTARAMPGDRERCLAAGMNDFLSKPISLRDLEEAIERWAFSDVTTS